MTSPPAVLVGTSLDGTDQRVLDAATAHARALGVRLYLVHVAGSEPDFVGLPKEAEAQAGAAAEGPEVGYAYDRTMAANRLKQLRHDLEQRREVLQASGIDAVALLIEGEPAEKLLAEAARLGAELIVIGTHQRGALSEWLLGSVSRELLHGAACPVLVVPLGRG